MIRQTLVEIISSILKEDMPICYKSNKENNLGVMKRCVGEMVFQLRCEEG